MRPAKLRMSWKVLTDEICQAAEVLDNELANVLWPDPTCQEMLFIS
jgi:glutamine synthetase type III